MRNARRDDFRPILLKRVIITLLYRYFLSIMYAKIADANAAVLQSPLLLRNRFCRRKQHNNMILYCDLSRT